MKFTKKRKLLILLVLVASSILPLFAQELNSKIIGRLVDKSGKSLANASIINLSNKTGTISNINGVFIISVNKFPLTLEINHIGFEKTITKISFDDFINNDGFFEIELISKSYYLDEVEITDNNEKSLFSSTNKNTILDYKTDLNKVLLLLKKGNKRVFRVTDTSHKTWYEISLAFKANSIFEDCQGNFHFIANDSVYQFVIKKADSSLYIFPAYSLSKFELALLNCVGFINNNFIFSKYHKHNQQILYWAVIDHEKKNIHRIFNNERYLFAQNLLDNKRELIAKYGIIDEMGNISVAGLQIARKIARLGWSYNMIGKIPAYSPLLIINDTILVFDHVKDSLYFYNSNGEFLQRLPINYHHNKKWDKLIYLDKVTNKVYLRFLQAGIITLSEFDIHTTTINSEILINDRLFPENISVYNNQLYYLYTNIGTGVKSLRVKTIE